TVIDTVETQTTDEDGNKVTETHVEETGPDGDKKVTDSKTTESTDSEGNPVVETESTTTNPDGSVVKTEETVKADSDGNVTTETTVEITKEDGTKTAVTTETEETGDGTTATGSASNEDESVKTELTTGPDGTVETETVVNTDKVDQSVLDEIISQTEALADATGTEPEQTVTIVTDGTVEIDPDVIRELSERFTLNLDFGFVVLVPDEDVLAYLESLGNTLTFDVARDLAKLTDAQRAVVGTGAIVTVDITAAGGAIHEMNGIVTVIYHYSTAAFDASTIRVLYIAEDGGIVEMPFTVDGGDVVFVTDHFSLYAIVTDDGYHTITWKDWDGTVLRTDRVADGETPRYGTNPVRESDGRYIYEFRAWTPEIVAATADAEYTAT
ncbi:MAG: hypothetical protein IJ856_03165, partial [Candidatus Methanomethylophilaceae archaeon]|nr:hypothetical protein [Candidatus Methanomethylophilaceae archaeon]